MTSVLVVVLELFLLELLVDVLDMLVLLVDMLDIEVLLLEILGCRSWRWSEMCWKYLCWCCLCWELFRSGLKCLCWKCLVLIDVLLLLL